MASNDPGQWLGLLKWSLAYQDGTKPNSEVSEMDQADKAWLTEAMAACTVDEAARMREIVDTLDKQRRGEGEGDGVDVEEWFEELQDIVEQIDQALNLHKIGKLEVLIEMLRDANPLYRACAAGVIATASQNNPKVQQVAIELGALAFSAHLMVHDP